MAIFAGSAAGVGATAYQCFRPRPRGTTRPFHRGETAEVITAFAIGAAAGTVASVLYVPLSPALHANLGDGIQSALVTSLILSPVYVSTVMYKNTFAAQNLPMLIAGAAVVAGGTVIGLGLVASLTGSRNVLAVVGSYQACLLTVGLGTSALGVFHFTNRYAVGSRYAIANSGRAGVCSELSTYLLQGIGNIAAYIMLSSALTLRRPVINPVMVDWWLIDFAILLSVPPQPSQLSLSGDEDSDEFSRYCDFIKRWWIIAGLSLVTHYMLPFSPLSWMIASQIYMDYQKDWNSLIRLEDTGRPLGGGGATPSWRAKKKDGEEEKSSWWDSGATGSVKGQKVGGATPDKSVSAAELRARAAENRAKREQPSENGETAS
eukprot:TRINITY_DN32595_c0_g1_i1.p1 TRINITY_DN32595_c0_g1~~TRINITY_DN32595_c0_g1_i1.p1  ORF type:complete len:410 (-),score=51.37 TRINITY_DN32595_c0_g1_i1:15-1142(-)